MNSKIKIMTDSARDIPAFQEEEYGIKILPFPITAVSYTHLVLEAVLAVPVGLTLAISGTSFRTFSAVLAVPAGGQIPTPPVVAAICIPAVRLAFLKHARERNRL